MEQPPSGDKLRVQSGLRPALIKLGCANPSPGFRTGPFIHLGDDEAVLRGLVVAAVLVLAFATFYPESRAVTGSTLGRHLLGVARVASWLGPSEVRQRFHQGASQMRQGPQDPQAGGDAGKKP